MTKITPNTIDSAPAASKPILEGAQKALGFVPNLYGVLSEAPAALHAYTAIGAALNEHASLSDTERNVVAIAISRDAGCGYCVAAHSTLADMAKAPSEVINAARDGNPIGDSKLEALRVFARAAVEKRGWLEDKDLTAFFQAGYEKKHVLEVMTLAALKTMSNYTNHVAETPLDEAFAPRTWKADAA